MTNASEIKVTVGTHVSDLAYVDGLNIRVNINDDSYTVYASNEVDVTGFIGDGEVEVATFEIDPDREYDPKTVTFILTLSQIELAKGLLESIEEHRNEVEPTREITPHKGGRTERIEARLTPETRSALDSILSESNQSFADWVTRKIENMSVFIIESGLSRVSTNGVTVSLKSLTNEIQSLAKEAPLNHWSTSGDGNEHLQNVARELTYGINRPARFYRDAANKDYYLLV